MNTINSDLIRGHIDTIILRALYDGDRYGYDIIKEIQQRTEGQYELKQPTLYSCLKRLEDQGFTSSYWGNKSMGGRKKYYSLTALGKELFLRNQNDWIRSKTIIDRLIAENAAKDLAGTSFDRGVFDTEEKDFLLDIKESVSNGGDFSKNLFFKADEGDSEINKNNEFTRGNNSLGLNENEEIIIENIDKNIVGNNDEAATLSQDDTAYLPSENSFSNLEMELMVDEQMQGYIETVHDKMEKLNANHNQEESQNQTKDEMINDEITNEENVEKPSDFINSKEHNTPIAIENAATYADKQISIFELFDSGNINQNKVLQEETQAQISNNSDFESHLDNNSSYDVLKIENDNSEVNNNIQEVINNFDDSINFCSPSDCAEDKKTDKENEITQHDNTAIIFEDVAADIAPIDNEIQEEEHLSSVFDEIAASFSSSYVDNIASEEYVPQKNNQSDTIVFEEEISFEEMERNYKVNTDVNKLRANKTIENIESSEIAMSDETLSTGKVEENKSQSIVADSNSFTSSEKYKKAHASLFSPNNKDTIKNKNQNLSKPSSDYTFLKYNTEPTIANDKQIVKRDYQSALTRLVRPSKTIFSNDSNQQSKLEKFTENVQDMGDEVIIRKHTSAIKEYDNANCFYSNRLKLFQYGTLFLIMLLETMGMFVVNELVLNTGLIEQTDLYIYIGGIVLSLLFPIIAFVANMTNYYKRKRKETASSGNFLFRFIIFAQFIVVIGTANVFLGILTGNIMDFLASFLYPLVMATNVIISGLIYKILVSSNKFNCKNN
jgi:PadR family transcriptional regulator PadR